MFFFGRGAQGSPGSGSQGAQGEDGGVGGYFAVFEFDVSTNVGEHPGEQKLRGSGGAAGTSWTSFIFDDADLNSFQPSSLISGLHTAGSLVMVYNGDYSAYRYLTTTNWNIFSGYLGFSGTAVAGDGTFTAGERVYLSMVPKGAQGFQGDQGSQGNQGSQGDQGFQGSAGFQGSQGDIGFQGSQGFQGFQGEVGMQGAVGAQGFQGDVGLQGSQGLKGDQGDTGLQGSVGQQGAQGFQGDVGLQGLKGEQGFQGDVGLQGTGGGTGLQGFQGDTGLQGLQGFQGDIGLQGNQGFQGDIGQQGSQGFQGDVGQQGFQGAVGDPSDRRLKTNIESYVSALDLLDSMRIYSYEWNDKAPPELVGKGEVGLIAQELDPIYNAAVIHGAQDEEFLRVNYAKLVPLLVRAVQELRQEVRRLSTGNMGS